MSYIFLDVDGTLTTYENKVPDSAKKAIELAYKNGHKVFLCTGRSKKENTQEILNLPISGYIGGNGAYIEVNNKVIFQKHLPVKDVKKIVSYLNSKGLNFYLEAESGLYASSDFKDKAIDYVCKYSGRIVEIDKIFPNMIYNSDLNRNDVFKISYTLNSYNDYLNVRAKFSNFYNNITSSKDEPCFAEIGVKNLNKAKAIQYLIDHLNIDINDTYSFGDGNNDIEMFNLTKFSSCMKNGTDEAKKNATFISSDVSLDGLLNAFKHFNLI